jgi:EPS-associated MarR family transcriptional regulator
MSDRRAQMQEEVRFRVLRLLQANPEMSQRDLAREVGISVGSVHYLLTALVDNGFGKLGKLAAAQDKRRYAYILTPKGIAEKANLTRHFLTRKKQEYQALRAEIDALSHELLCETDAEPEDVK